MCVYIYAYTHTNSCEVFLNEKDSIIYVWIGISTKNQRVVSVLRVISKYITHIHAHPHRKNKYLNNFVHIFDCIKLKTPWNNHLNLNIFLKIIIQFSEVEILYTNPRQKCWVNPTTSLKNILINTGNITLKSKPYIEINSLTS